MKYIFSINGLSGTNKNEVEKKANDFLKNSLNEGQEYQLEKETSDNKYLIIIKYWKLVPFWY